MTLQEQRIDGPNVAQIQAWLKQLDTDRKEQERVVLDAERALERAKRDAEQIARNIKAGNAMIAALKDAGQA